MTICERSVALSGTRKVVSIVMPCYNSAGFIANAVSSVLKQTYPHFELIVVNDGSSDASLEILRSISDSRLVVITQQNRGVIEARNRGIHEACGDYLAFLDADDSWREDFLEKMVAALEARPQAVLAYCGWQNVGLPGPRGAPFIPPNYEDEYKVEKLLYECRWPIHAALVKRGSVLSAGSFDNGIRTAEDYWLWLRIAAQNPIVRVAEVMSMYVHHGTQRSTAKNMLQKGLDRWKIRRTFVARYPKCVSHLSRRRIRELTHGRLLEWGYECHWQRDFDAARPIFRTVMRYGYGRLNDWKIMLPSLLPKTWHQHLARLFEKRGEP